TYRGPGHRRGPEDRASAPALAPRTGGTFLAPRRGRRQAHRDRRANPGLSGIALSLVTRLGSNPALQSTAGRLPFQDGRPVRAGGGRHRFAGPGAAFRPRLVPIGTE